VLRKFAVRCVSTPDLISQQWLGYFRFTIDAMKLRMYEKNLCYLVRNRFCKTETSFEFGFGFQCVNGLHKTSFYANMQWVVSPRDMIMILLQFLFSENQ